MAKADEIVAIFELADRKGYDVDKAILRGHVRLTDPEGRRVVKEGGSSAFTYAEAREFLEKLPDRPA